MILYDPFADSQPNARTVILISAMQPLKHLEDTFGITLFKPDSIVIYTDLSILTLNRKTLWYFVAFQRSTPDSDVGRAVRVAECDGINNQVLKQLPELGSIARNGR